MKKSIFVLFIIICIPALSSGCALSQSMTRVSVDTSEPDSSVISEYPDINDFVPVDKAPMPVKIVRPVFSSLGQKS